MKFRIEAQLELGLKRYRLQKDGNWRRMSSALSKNHPEFCKDDNPQQSDQVYDTLMDAGIFIGTLTNEVEIDGKKHPLKDLEGGTLHEIHQRVYIQPMVYRITKPERFTQQEVKSIIAIGNDNVHNTLTLDLEGRVALRQFRGMLLSNCLPIAVRKSSFCAGNEYIGQEAARDADHVNEQYLSLLEGWVTHLMTGELNIMPDWNSNKSAEELWKEVDYLTEHLK